MATTLADDERDVQYRCPRDECGSTDISVTVSVVRRLIQEDDGTLTLEDDRFNGGCEEWGPDSDAVCNACNYRGCMANFDEETGGLDELDLAVLDKE